jgi:hypothetical protein
MPGKFTVFSNNDQNTVHARNRKRAGGKVLVVSRATSPLMASGMVTYAQKKTILRAKSI